MSLAMFFKEENIGGNVFLRRRISQSHLWQHRGLAGMARKEGGIADSQTPTFPALVRFTIIQQSGTFFVGFEKKCFNGQTPTFPQTALRWSGSQFTIIQQSEVFLF